MIVQISCFLFNSQRDLVRVSPDFFLVAIHSINELMTRFVKEATYFQRRFIEKLTFYPFRKMELDFFEPYEAFKDI